MGVARSHTGLFKLAVLCAVLFASMISPEARAAADAKNSGEFQLKGTLVTGSTRWALVSGASVQEGERVGDIEILAIRNGEVDIRQGSRWLTVPVGATADWGRASQVAESYETSSYGPVRRGETLSEIAERLLVDDMTINQMMIALYDANRDAFADNINVLHEGATLRIPDRDAAHRRAPVTATAEVIRHASAWRGNQDPQTGPSSFSGPDVYGPVTRGETLSAIAASLSRNVTTMNQMMIALFEANPQAFEGNINVLKVGAVLRIPDETALQRLSYETATAAVERHMDALRHDAVRPPQPPVVVDELMTHQHERLHLPGAILFSVPSTE